MAEDKFRGEISEKDIEKENLRPSDIDGVAGGIGFTFEPIDDASDKESKAPARDISEAEMIVNLESNIVK